MTGRTGTLIVLLLFSINVLSSAESNSGKYRKIPDLSNSSVNIIYQDSLEYIWIGTWDGLNRYDGKQTTAYFPELGDELSISNNIIRDIKEEKKGILWIETDWGINRFDIRSGNFRRFFLGYEDHYPDREDVYSISISYDGTIFASAWGWGLAYYDSAAKDFIPINSTRFSTQNILRTETDREGSLWLHNDDGHITKVDWKKEGGKVLITGSDTIDSLTAKFFKIHDGYLITVDNDNWLRIFDIRNRETVMSRKLRNLLLNINIIAQHIIITYKSGQSESFIIGNRESTPDFRPYNMIPNITCHLQGTQNTTWIGTDGDGVYMFYDQRKRFGKILLDNISGPIRAITEDAYDRIIAGTKGDGIYITEPGSHEQIHLTTDDGLISDRVYCLQKNIMNDIFIGTEGAGINILKGNRLHHLDFSGHSFQDFKSVSGIYAMAFTNNDSTLWVGTAYYGLIRIGLKYDNGTYMADSIRIFPYNRHPKRTGNNAIYKIIADGDNLLIATRGNGVLNFDMKSMQYRDIKCPDNSIRKIISNNDVLSLYQDSDYNLWVGTSMGLNRMTYNKDSVLVEMFIHKNDFPNNTIHGILEDWENNIWISTNSGLSKMDKSRNTIVSYNESDGLQGNEFCDGAYYSGKGGFLYFGGTKGLNRFNPVNIVPDTYIPQLHIEDIRINNVQSPIKSISSIDMQNGDNRLVFKYNENNISLRLIVTDYINNENCEFSYFLEGFSRDWTYLGNSPNIFFPNLPHGKYRLKIRYTNNEKLWSDDISVLDFMIRPPIWKSHWALIGYIIVICSAAIIAAVKIRRKIENERKEFQKKIAEREKELVHNAKLSFFTNIANEFITPLSLIYGPSIKIEDYSKADSYVKKYASIIHSNAKRLNQLVSEITDFHNAANSTNIFYEYINISEQINGIIRSFSDLAEEKSLTIENSSSASGAVMCVSDRYCTEKILFSLISNAYRNAPENSTITIDCHYGNAHEILFAVSDHGNWIDQESMTNLFNRFAMLENIEKKNSDNLIYQSSLSLSVSKSLANRIGGDISMSSHGDGTTFILRLPPHEASDRMIREYETDQKFHMSLTGNEATEELIRGKNILIIEEDTSMRLLIRDSLNADAPHIIESEDVGHGMEILRRHKIDLVVIGAFVYGIPGVDFIKELKNDSILQHIPILFISRNLDEKYKNLALASGADTVISMPFNPNHFRNVVNAIFNQRQIYEKYSRSAISSMEMAEGKLIHHEDRIFMEELTKYIDSCLDNETLNIDAVCAHMNISRISLYRRIKSLAGCTISDYIKSLKMKRACQMLKETKLSVKEIMYKCGYNHKSLFYKHFETEYKMTPKEYRDSLFGKRTWNDSHSQTPKV